MSIFTTRIHDNVYNEIKRREDEISRNSVDLSHLYRYPFVVLQSNAVDSNGSSILAEKYILHGRPIIDNTSQTEFIVNSELGIRPPAGIVSIDVNNVAPLGSVRRAVVNFQVWDTQELEKYQVLYMNPGIYLFLQWGYHSANQTNFNVINMFEGNTRMSIKELMKPHHMRKIVLESSGSYDALVGICSTFTWKLNANGGYDCSTTIISPASLSYTFAFNRPSMEDNAFYLWMTNKSDDPSLKSPTSGSEQLTSNLSVLNNITGGATLKEYAKTILADKSKNKERFMGNGAEYPKFIQLNSSISKISNNPEDLLYISFGHLCTLINVLFLYSKNREEVADNIRKLIVKDNNGVYTKKDFIERNIQFIDMDRDDCIFRASPYLRSFNPAQVLLFFKAAESLNEKSKLYNIVSKTVDGNIIESEITPSPSLNFPPPTDSIKYGRTKAIFLNVNFVISKLQSTEFNTFLDAILETINSSVGEFFKLIKDNDDIEINSIAVVDYSLVPDAHIAKVFNVYQKNTVIRNLTLDASIPSSFQTAAYVGNTAANPMQRDHNVNSAFSAVSNGYVDADGYGATINQNSNSNVLYDVALQATSSYDYVMKRPLDDTTVSSHEKDFFTVLKYFYTTQGDTEPKVYGFPVGITLSIELDGISGFYYGNLFRLNYVPEFLQRNVIFQITNVEHSVSVSGWITKLTGLLRAYIKGADAALPLAPKPVSYSRTVRDVVGEGNANTVASQNLPKKSMIEGPELILLHWTGGNASPEATINYWETQRPGVGAHWVVGRDGRAVNYIEENKVIGHAVGFNSISIGIEIVNYGFIRIDEDEKVGGGYKPKIYTNTWVNIPVTTSPLYVIKTKNSLLPNQYYQAWTKTQILSTFEIIRKAIVKWPKLRAKSRNVFIASRTNGLLANIQSDSSDVKFYKVMSHIDTANNKQKVDPVSFPYSLLDAFLSDSQRSDWKLTAYEWQKTYKGLGSERDDSPFLDVNGSDSYYVERYYKYKYNADLKTWLESN